MILCKLCYHERVVQTPHVDDNDTLTPVRFWSEKPTTSHLTFAVRRSLEVRSLLRYCHDPPAISKTPLAHLTDIHVELTDGWMTFHIPGRRRFLSRSTVPWSPRRPVQHNIRHNPSHETLTMLTTFFPEIITSLVRLELPEPHPKSYTFVSNKCVAGVFFWCQLQIFLFYSNPENNEQHKPASLTANTVHCKTLAFS